MIDVSQLGQHGFFTFDPGFLATASCESKITYIDGQKGILRHRGYSIDALAQESSFLEVCCCCCTKSYQREQNTHFFKKNQ